jgi:ribonuclease E
MVRSVESVALDILRSIEDRLITDGVVPLVATTAVDVALYILNQKRAHLNDIQQRYRIPITVTADEDMHISQFVIERAAEGEVANGGGVVVHMDWAHHPEAVPASASAPVPAPERARAPEGEGDQARRRSRRRRRGRRHPEGTDAQRPDRAERPEPGYEDDGDDEPIVADAAAEETKTAEASEDGAQRKGPRRRGRRGGRRGRAGQRPERAGGEEARADAQDEGEVRQNGAGRKPLSEESPKEDVAHQPPHAAERILETADTSGETATKSSEAHAEARTEPEAPRRRGWWQR